VLVDDRAVADYFERVLEADVAPKEAANWITGELFRLMKAAERNIRDLAVSAEALAGLITLVEEGKINQTTGKDVLEEMFASGRDAHDIVSEQGLAQISDVEELHRIVTQVLDENPDQVAEYLDGKKQVLGWFIGRVMRATRGKANPQLARRLLKEKLEARRG
jgi:aspartyl-tRNA(Asn)/glutamyl-tRNA(Gln) amidotransferase subunit B